MTEFPKASLGFWGEEIFLLNQPKHNWGVCVCVEISRDSFD